MRIESYGHRTSMLLNKVSGKITDYEGFLAIKTPDRPDFFWGNYLLFKDPPKEGEFREMLETYESIFGPVAKQGFAAMTWDVTDHQPVLADFLKFGFEVQTVKVLTAKSVQAPPHQNDAVVVKEYAPLERLDDYVDVHFDPNWKYGSHAAQKSFIASSLRDFLALNRLTEAKRIGAFRNNSLVGDLGFYRVDDCFRFNNVSTHRNYRRSGICGTIVYQTCQKILETNHNATLVMEADANYHAARIYERIGFCPQEILYLLEWFDPNHENFA